MPKPLALALSREAFNALAEAAAKKTRGGNQFVKVSKANLAALVMDHGATVRALHAAGVETQDAQHVAADLEEAEDGEDE